MRSERTPHEPWRPNDRPIEAPPSGGPDGSPRRAALAAELRAHVRGEVRFDTAYRAIYSTDASNYRQIPLGVVMPRDASDVEATVAVCRRFDVPIVSRGGGTALAGQTCNDAVVLDMSKHMNRVLYVDPRRRQAGVQPGCVLDDLRDRAQEHQLTFGPDPATHNRNTLGGMIGNNSCGMHAQMAGKVEENIDELEVLTYDGLRLRVGATSDEELSRIIEAGGRRGEIYAGMRALRDRYGDLIRARFPKIPRRVSGFPLNELLPENGFHVARALVGTESTCVTVLEATCRLVHSPPCRALVVAAFPDLGSAADMVPTCDEHQPIALEAVDDNLFSYMRQKGMSSDDFDMFPEGHAWLIVEFGADEHGEVARKCHALREALEFQGLRGKTKVYEGAAEQRRIWELREAALGSTSKIPGLPDFYPGWEDSAVAPERLGDYVRKFQALLQRYDYHASVYGHFGQGCVHCSIDFDLFTAEGIKKYRAFVTEAAHLCVEHGGSLSGEHGDGQSRGELLPIMYGDELVRAFGEFKALWDPRNRMNPGKVVHPNKLDENLRWGAGYHPWEPSTHFAFRADHGSFAYAANRCVGTGKCRKHDSGTMCPSYMATRDEMHSTRGRSRALFEMLQGDPVRDKWRDDAVKETLDLCLSCKACKNECPVNVDMATYKAEFLSHYYEGRARPLDAYAFGLAPIWLRIASLVPAAANFFMQAPPFAGLAKAAISVAPQRRIPLIADRTFRRWFAQRRRDGHIAARNLGKKQVILWPDTWNDHFHPNSAQAAVEVLEDAGFDVTIPQKPLCCGRPLYDYGMLDLAKRFLRETLDELRPQIELGVPVVGLEPSCMSVFRDEMVDLLPGDADAKRLHDQTFLLGDFLLQQGYQPRPVGRRAVVHGHCHQKSIQGMSAEQQLLQSAGCDVQLLDAGCCGMAGAFGFHSGDQYDVSIKCGERALLPAVRNAGKRELIVADGFSCREQIAQCTHRRALHFADVLRLGLEDARTPAERRTAPEAELFEGERIRRLVLAGYGVMAAVGVTALTAAWLAKRT
jgi:FAD/FMN-containing dehydrogenase/Fe-S oxidoreductase